MGSHLRLGGDWGLGPLAINILWEAGRKLESGLNPDCDEHDRFNESLMCCLPKQSSHTTSDGEQVYAAENTRPLSITNTDNRLIANAFRIRWEPLLGPTVVRDQRGFIQGRSMLKNIIEVEHAAMCASLQHEDAAIVLFDFTAAFPSISREYLMATAESAGLPPTAMHVLRSLYHNTTGVLFLNGKLHGSVPFLSGIRQGCPLSPLLFALASDSLLRILKYRHKDAVVKAFADDTAMVLPSWSRSQARVFNTFKVFEKVSRLALNYAKTVAIPLWRESISDIQARMAADTDMPNIDWRTTGKYLGMFIGPEKRDNSWTKTAAKYQDRLLDWPWSEMGLHPAIYTYNTYVLPVVLFVAQLEEPPGHVLALEQKAVRAIAPGPGNWCNPQDLHFGDALGLAHRLRPLQETCQASMLRMHRWEAHADEGTSWARLRTELNDNLSSTRFLVRRGTWDNWYKSHAPTVVLKVVAEAAAKGITAERTRAAVTGVEIGPLTVAMEKKHKRGTQNWFSKQLLQQRGFSPEMRIRHKVDRWQLQGPPARTARTIHRNLLKLRRLVPPRVRAAVLSTLYNRWVTDRRMRSIRRHCQDTCVLGCSARAKDSIEHYIHCPIIRSWMGTRLGTGGALRTREHWMMATPMDDVDLRRMAVTVYVAYRTTNHTRHHRNANQEYIKQYMNQMLHEAARDDAALRQCCCAGDPQRGVRRRRGQ